MVSKGMRMIAQGKDPLEGQKHMCGMGNLFNYHSTGYPELDELMREPQPLIFIMELISVGIPPETHTKKHTHTLAHTPKPLLRLSILNIPRLNHMPSPRTTGGSVQPTFGKPLKPENKQSVTQPSIAILAVSNL